MESGKPSRGTRSAAERANGQSTSTASRAGNANANGKLTAKCDGPLDSQRKREREKEKKRQKERDNEEETVHLTAAGKQQLLKYSGHFRNFSARVLIEKVPLCSKHRAKYEGSLIDIDCLRSETVDKGAPSQTEAAREREKEREGGAE